MFSSNFAYRNRLWRNIFHDPTSGNQRQCGCNFYSNPYDGITNPTMAAVSPTPTLLHSSDYPSTPTFPPPTPTYPPIHSPEATTVPPTATPKPTGPLPAMLKGKEAAVINAFPKAVLSLVWSPDGKILAAASRGGTSIGLWNSQGQSLGVLNQAIQPASETEGLFASLAWSPDGKILAATLNNSTIRLWSLNQDYTGKVLAELSGHTGIVTSLAWSPDGQTLASGSMDSSVRFWNSAGKSLAVLTGHTGIVPRLAWSPDGKILASAGGVRYSVPQGQQDSTIRL